LGGRARGPGGGQQGDTLAAPCGREPRQQPDHVAGRRGQVSRSATKKSRRWRMAGPHGAARGTVGLRVAARERTGLRVAARERTGPRMVAQKALGSREAARGGHGRA
jgi:hypothetical protein